MIEKYSTFHSGKMKKHGGQTRSPELIDPHSTTFTGDSNLYVPCLPRALWYFVVNVVATACYTNSLWCDLVHDDVFAIKQNLDLRPETSLRQVFLDDFWGKPMSSNISHKSYRPICVLTFRLNYILHGLDPVGYHAVNVLLHVLVCSVFLYTCERVVLKSLHLAVVAALLFAAHPVHTEAVTGVVGRADVLAGLLFLLAFLSFVRATRTSSESSSLTSSVYLLLCVFLGSAAMLVKEHGVTVFGLCVVYDVFVNHRDFVKRILKERKVHAILEFPKHLILRLLAMIGVVVGLMTFRLWMLRGHLPHFSKQDNPASFADSIATRTMTYCYLFTFNAWLLLSPNVLCYDWQIDSIPLVESFLDIRNVAAAAFFIVLFLIVFLATLSTAVPRSEQNQLILGLALVVIPFLPASNLFFRVGFVVAERILYIPSMGFCVLVAIGLNKLASLGTNGQVATPANNNAYLRSSTKSLPNVVQSRQGSTSKAVTMLVSLLVVTFCWKTTTRNMVWKSRETLFISGVETIPHNGKVHYNYANFLKDAGRDKEAEKHYRRTLELVPDHVSAHNNLGTLLTDDKEAEKHFLLALKYDPYHANSYFNLGSRYGELGELDQAEKMLREATRLNPEYIDALLNLAGIVDKRGRKLEAEELYERVLGLAPTKSDAFNNYGVFLVNTGRPAEAVKKYTRAIELNPQHHIALVNLGRALRTLGRNEEAVSAYKSGLAIKREASTLHLLGVLYYHSNQLQDAEATWKEAMELDPVNPEICSNLAVLFSRTGRRAEAVDILQGLLRDHPKNPEHYKSLAGIFAQMGKTDQALSVINQALNVAPMAELYYDKGNLLRDQKKMKEAGESFSEAAKMDPNHYGAHMNLGVILHMEGSYRQARKHYEVALTLNPNSDNAVLLENLRKLSRIEHKQKSR